MITVVALGGNALARRGEPLDIESQRRNVERAAAGVELLGSQHWVVLTHGNGPQVGLFALQNEAYRGTRPYPLDVLNAETEGMIGYLLEQELGRRRCPDLMATLLTQVVVDLARKLWATMLVLLTDVDAVYHGYGTADATPIRRAGVEELRRLPLPAGSMAPKVEAACRFVENGGRSLIGSLDDVAGLLAGEAGTEVVRGSAPITFHSRHDCPSSTPNPPPVAAGTRMARIAS